MRRPSSSSRLSSYFWPSRPVRSHCQSSLTWEHVGARGPPCTRLDRIARAGSPSSATRSSPRPTRARAVPLRAGHRALGVVARAPARPLTGDGATSRLSLSRWRRRRRTPVPSRVTSSCSSGTGGGGPASATPSGGRTAAAVGPPAPVRGPGGALFGGTNLFGNGSPSVVRSRDGGQTWTALFGYSGVYPYGLAHAAAVPEPPAGGLPEGGAFVAADAFGLAWAHGSVQEDGEGGGRLPWQNVPGLPLRFFSVDRRRGRPARRREGRALPGGEVRRGGQPEPGLRLRRRRADVGRRVRTPAPGGGLCVVAAPDGAAYAYHDNDYSMRQSVRLVGRGADVERPRPGRPRAGRALAHRRRVAVRHPAARLRPGRASLRRRRQRDGWAGPAGVRRGGRRRLAHGRARGVRRERGAAGRAAGRWCRARYVRTRSAGVR